MKTRRDVMKAAMAAVAGAAATPLPVLAQAAPRVTPLGAGAVLVEGAGGNVLAVSDGAALTLADSGASGMTEGLLAALAGVFPGQPVATLVNTHWHPDQTGGNAAIGGGGARIVAHANTRSWLTTDVAWPWGGAAAPLPQQAWPTDIFRTGIHEQDAGARLVRCGHMLQAHTDGDAWAYFPQANVLHVGGAVSADRWTLIDWWTGGWIGGVVEATETLLQVADEDTIIVASDGPAFDRAELARQRDMYADLFLVFRDELLFSGLSPAEAVAELPTRGLRPEWGDPDLFVERAFQSMWRYYVPDA